jgi:hypothetical protein
MSFNLAQAATVEIQNDFSGTSCSRSDTDQLKCALCLAWMETGGATNPQIPKARQMIIRTMMARAEHLHRSLCEEIWARGNIQPRHKLPDSKHLKNVLEDTMNAILAGPSDTCLYRYSQRGTPGPAEGMMPGEHYADVWFYRCRDKKGSSSSTPAEPEESKTVPENQE